MAAHRVGARQEPHTLATGRDIFTHPMVEWRQPGDSRVLAARSARRNLSRQRQRRSPEGKKLSDGNLPQETAKRKILPMKLSEGPRTPLKQRGLALKTGVIWQEVTSSTGTPSQAYTQVHSPGTESMRKLRAGPGFREQLCLFFLLL